MPDPEPAGARPEPPYQSAVGVVAQRLTSQPLLFGFGVLLLLVVVAASAVDVLRVLMVPALVIFVVGALVWLAVELPKARRRSTPTAGVRVRARDIGAQGTVAGIEGLPATYAPPSVDVEAGGYVDGTVRGVGYARPGTPGDPPPPGA